jgi:glutamyl-tRNA reductase
MRARESVPLIRRLRENAETARQHELERALSRLERGEDPKSVLEGLSQGLTNKLMHAPTRALNREGDEALQQIVARIYQLGTRD